MITTGREFDTYEEAAEALLKAEEAYAIGYGFYPHPVHVLRAGNSPYIGCLHDVYFFTYSRGESCD